MTLTTYPEIEQGSDEWHDQRRGIITASMVGKLITPKTVKPASNPESRSLTMLLTSERITGWTEPMYVNSDMQRGIDDEPIARELYAKHYAPVAQTGFMVEDQWGFKIGFSPDGLVGDEGLIEVKSRRPKAQVQTILRGYPPIENMAQLQCGLLVSGREWVDYVSYASGMPLFVKRVYPQQKWFDAIVEAAEKLEENIIEMLRVYDDSIIGLHPTERITHDILI